MKNHDDLRRSNAAPLTVVKGGRRQREEELLGEFLHPGIGNVQRIRRLADQLRYRAKLTLFNRERSGSD